MEIELLDCGKRFRLEWIFRGLSCTLSTGERLALLGPNGSGKSTLMKILSGHLSPSRGTAFFKDPSGQVVPASDMYTRIAYAAPYIELIEELTLEETLRFHARLKPFLPGLNPSAVYELLQLPRSRQKELRFFSSGMKQRVKIALAAASDTPILLLDEPTTNLDVQAVQWYKDLVARLAEKRLVVIASNDPDDALFCPRHLNILDYKS